MSKFTKVYGEQIGKGNANMVYSIYATENDDPISRMLDISFQDGDPNKFVNGIFNEDLLEVLIDRFEGFQSGDFKCDENRDALIHLRKALEIMESRTGRRKDQGLLYKYEEK